MADASNYHDILHAARSALLSLGTVPPASVRVRKRPAFRKQHDPLPLVLVCPEAEILGEMQFGNNEFMDYPVLVVLIDESALVIEDDSRLAWQLARRQEARRKLHVTTLAGAPTVFDVVGYDPSPAFDAGGLDNSFDVSAQRFTYRSSEQRADA